MAAATAGCHRPPVDHRFSGYHKVVCSLLSDLCFWEDICNYLSHIDVRFRLRLLNSGLCYFPATTATTGHRGLGGSGGDGYQMVIMCYMAVH